MATFTNYATLSYNGGTTDSNTVTGQLIEALTASKTAVLNDYTTRDDVTYIISLINSGTTALTGLTITDDLGGYTFNQTTVYPLAYQDGSLRYYVNGVLQTVTAAQVTAGPPLVITDITVPAGGNAFLVYEAAVTNYAPLGATATITNQATITGDGISEAVTVEETINARVSADLTISKALYPTAVTENGQLTYTFVIENTGSAAAEATDNVVLTDTFNPRLSGITVTFNGTVWTEGVNYTYNPNTGVFATVAGQITVPAAEYAQNESGVWTVTPGTATLTITGTI